MSTIIPGSLCIRCQDNEVYNPSKNNLCYHCILDMGEINKHIRMGNVTIRTREALIAVYFPRSLHLDTKFNQETLKPIIDRLWKGVQEQQNRE